MKNIWLYKEELEMGENYIYGDGYNAEHMYAILRKYTFPIKGFIRAYTKDVNSLSGLDIIDLNELIEGDSNILITQNKWMNIYDYLSDFIDTERLYSLGNWVEGDDCIVCNSKKTMKAGGEFVPFLRERMFRGIEVRTSVVHCCNCGIYYSEYRPSDEEMALLYSGYRNSNYQVTRQKYEPYYTVEFNNKLFEPKDVAGRKEMIFAYISRFVNDTSSWKTILDFGGDKGQFIPDQWKDKRRIVYEISKPKVVDGVELVSDYSSLKEYSPDLIMCNQVLEHVSDVRGYFFKLISILKAGAYLYIEVPNERWCVDQEYVRFHEHINVNFSQF